MGYLNGFIEEMVVVSKLLKSLTMKKKTQLNLIIEIKNFMIPAVEALTYSGRTIPTVVSISYFNYALVASIGGLFAINGIMDLGSLSSYLVFVRQTASLLTNLLNNLTLFLRRWQVPKESLI